MGLLAQEEPGAPAVAKAADPAAELLRQIEQYREAITKKDLPIEARRQAAQFLVSGEPFPAKVVLVRDLLAAPDAQVRLLTVGAVVGAVAQYPAGLPSEYVDPLIDMLRGEAADLRALAAQALSYSRDPDVAKQLGTIARDEPSPLAVRLAAIEALAPNIDRRDVAAQLVALLDGGVTAVVRRVVAVLEAATGESHGMDLERWKAWWSAKSKLDDLAWRTYRMEYHQARARALDAELKRTREQLSTRLRDFQKDSFRAIPREQKELREARLSEWLADPVPEIRQNALSILAVLVGDEGYRPAGNVLTGLRRLLGDPLVDIRLASVRMIENLQDSANVPTVLERLKEERDSGVRQALIRVLGALGGVEVVPALIAEVGPESKDTECAQEAAAALGQVAARAENRALFAPAVEALSGRYAAAPPEATRMRAVLLRGMAGIADVSFADEFSAALDTDQADLLRPAIRGMVAIKDSSRLARFRDLIGAHADQGVRLEAIRAVAEFGRDNADIDCLLGRLNSAAEPTDEAREAAWQGFTRIMGARPLADQLMGVDRLRDLPGLKIRYLSELEDRLATQNGSPSDLEQVRDRLATELVTSGEFALAVDYLRDLHRTLLAKRDPRSLDVGLRLIEAALRGKLDLIITEVLAEVAQGANGDPQAPSRISSKVGSYLESEAVRGDRVRATALVERLRESPSATLGEDWARMLEAVETSLAQPPVEPDEPGGT